LNWPIHCQGGAKSVMRFLYHKQLRDFYYIGNLVQATKAKMKLLIKKIISNKYLGKINYILASKIVQHFFNVSEEALSVFIGAKFNPFIF